MYRPGSPPHGRKLIFAEREGLVSDKAHDGEDAEEGEEGEEGEKREEGEEGEKRKGEEGAQLVRGPALFSQHDSASGNHR